MITDIQRKTALAIVNVFETGSAHGDYGRVTLLKNDSGHLTYGRSQTTLASGNLYLLVKAYCDAPGALFAPDFRQYVNRLAGTDPSLDTDQGFRTLLQNAGGDPVMHDVQNQFFDRVFWNPALQSSNVLGITTPLGTAVVYDSYIQGSWGLLRNMTTSQFGTCAILGEQTWIGHYVEVRKAWLANNVNTLLHSTVYRMEAFGSLLAAAMWDLPLPLIVRGVTIDQAALEDHTPILVSAQTDADRILMLSDPPKRGVDVQAVQTALQKAGFALQADGIFGKETDSAVRAFQQAKGLKIDGIVGPATRAALSL